MQKREELTQQTKQNLREAFWSLYIQKPIEKITVKEIPDTMVGHGLSYGKHSS